MRRQRVHIKGVPGSTGCQALADLIAGGRARRGLTLAALAHEVGVTEAFIRKLEKGQRPLTNPETVSEFAEALGLSEDLIYSVQGIPPPDVMELLYSCARLHVKRARWALQKIANGEMFDEELLEAAVIAEKIRGDVLIPRKRTAHERRQLAKAGQ